MKRAIVIASILSMLGTSVALAQNAPPPPRPNASQGQKPGQAQPNRPQSSKPQPSKPQPNRPQAGKPAPQHSQWSRGKQLPPNYRHNVVRDYGRYRLAPPPRGYNWVRVNNEYLLISIASGLISSIVRPY
ncbi:RcnB family protein [Ancylobacter sp. Lp-2]|uniref:RcnB family protein n=1 Tax=Ancylobacter sp. Lp-2 TaxID=2881339 RepID=UPI001E44FD2F|nr:RcnB family protein [Ancylobacter sp. Lp-2]MCB4771925.1 RcnB family protein [Ancylobacter sp. Lp-2]